MRQLGSSQQSRLSEEEQEEQDAAVMGQLWADSLQNSAVTTGATTTGRRGQSPLLFQQPTGTTATPQQDVNAREEALRHMTAVAGSRWLQHWLALDRNSSALQRCNQWAQALLDSLFKWPSQQQQQAVLLQEQAAALQALCALVESLHEAPPAVVAFLREFLATWDGSSHLSLIVRLLRWLPPLPWEDLFALALRPIGKLFFVLPARSKALLLDTYAQLLRQWLQIDWAAYHIQGFTRQHAPVSPVKQQQGGMSSPQQQRSAVPPSPQLRPLDLGFTFNAVESTQVDFYRTLYELVRYVDQLAALALHSETASPAAASADHVAIQHAILNFFDIVSRLHSRYKVPFVVTPSPAVVYRCLLAGNAAALSRICGILARYKAEFDKLKTMMAPPTAAAASAALAAAAAVGAPPPAMTPPLSFQNGAEKINVLNCYIWSFCGALWRQRLFIPPPDFLRDELLLPPDVLEQIRFEGMSSCLGLTHAPAMLSLAREYLNALHAALDNSNNPAATDSTSSAAAAAAAASNQDLTLMKPEMIKDVVKEHYVEYLQQRGLHGLHNFLFSFIAALVKLSNNLHQHQQQPQPQPQAQPQPIQQPQFHGQQTAASAGVPNGLSASRH